MNLQIKISKHVRKMNVIKLKKKKTRRNYSKMTANIKTSFYGLSSIERMRKKRKRRRIMILITSTTK